MKIEQLNNSTFILAAFLHDIGKLRQRTDHQSKFFKDESTYQRLMPYYSKGKPSHFHVLHTLDFFEENNRGLNLKPYQIDNSLEEDSLENLCACHHKPSTPIQWIISEADCISSGIDRKKMDELYMKEAQSGRKAYLKERLIPVFSHVDIGKETNEKCKEYRIPLTFFNGNFSNYLPEHKTKLDPDHGVELQKPYMEIYKGFCSSFDKIFYPDHDISYRTIEQFVELCRRYFYAIPSSTIDIPDISLFDHSTLIAAISVAIFHYQKENNQIKEDNIKDRNEKKFRLIQGDMSGIQSYILQFKQEATKGLAKTLRGRSFYVSLLAKSIERKILKKLSLPFTSTIMFAGSKFQILAPNNSSAPDLLKEIQFQVDRWMLDRYQGKISFQLDWSQEISGNDLQTMHVFTSASDALNNSKKRKFYTLFRSNNEWNEASFRFDSIYEKLQKNGECSSYGFFPAEDSKNDNSKKVSKIALEEEETGKKLLNAEFISFSSDNENSNLKTGSLPFGSFRLDERDGDLRIHFDVNDFRPTYSLAANIPKLTQSFLDKNKKKIRERLRADEEFPKAGDNMTFEHIAMESIGKDLLGVFKADVDSLGEIFTSGLKEKMRSISRYVGLSQSLNLFFTEFLNELLSREFPSIYTVYSGGDDLLLIGPYTHITKFAIKLHDEFQRLVAFNGNITFSGGIALFKPKHPIQHGVELAESELENAKGFNRGKKNAVSIFGTALNWEEYRYALQLVDELQYYIEQKLSTSFIYTLLHFTEEDKLMKSQPEKAIYRSHLAYLKARNIIKNNDLFPELKSDEKKHEQEKLNTFITELFNEKFDKTDRSIVEFLKVPLQLLLYQNRGSK